MYVCVYVCMHACMYVCVYVCVCMYVCTHGGLPQLNFRIGLYTPLSNLRVPEVRPRDCLNSISALGFTHLWAASGYHKWDQGIVSTQFPQCVLHAFEQPQGTISEAEGMSQLNFRMRADAGHRMRDTSAVPLLHCAIPWLCQWSLESALCVVCSERGVCEIHV